METQDLPAIMTRAQLAEYLNMTPTALSLMASRKKGPPMLRIGRSVRYRRDDVLAWLEGQVVNPQEPVGRTLRRRSA